MKISYKAICEGIFHNSEEGCMRDDIRSWIMIFEKFKVKGWDRNTFLDAMIEVKKLNGDKNEIE